MKKRIIYTFLVLLLPFSIKIVLASELTITHPQYIGDTNISDQLEGDCAIMQSNGETLLMDTCRQRSYTLTEYPGFKRYLKNLNLTHFSVYISHYHEDHYGGLMELLNDPEFTIDRVYLPKTEYFCEGMMAANEIIEQTDKTYFNTHYTNINNILNGIIEKNIPITFLWPENVPYKDENNKCFNQVKDLETEYENSLTFGDVTINIIGPVGNHYLRETAENDTIYNGETLTYWHAKKSIQDEGENYYVPGDTDESKKKHVKYLGGDLINNMSLVAKITVGNTTIFSAGDIEIEEELALIDRYGASLKSDIMKLSHHGSTSSNIEELLKVVKPKYTYATALYSHPAHAGPNAYDPSAYDTSIQRNNRFNYLINGDWDNNTSAEYRGANTYSTGYNGKLIFLIKDDFIRVRTQSSIFYTFPTDAEEVSEHNNKYTITLKAVDQDGNKILSQLHDFTLDTSDNYIKNIPFKIYNHVMPINGYFYQSDNIPDDNTVLSTDKTYTLNYKKALTTNTDILNLNDTDLLIKTKNFDNLECIDDTEINKKCHLEIQYEKNNIDLFDENNTLTFYTIGNHLNNNSYARTGDKISVTNGRQTYSYNFLLLGDVTTDGWVQKDDTEEIAKYIIDGGSDIDSKYLSAGDIDEDTEIKMNDVMRIINKIKIN